MTEPALTPGDRVEWNTSQGKTLGTVVREVDSTARVKNHVAKASAAQPEFEVRSARSGKTAIHRPDALKKVR